MVVSKVIQNKGNALKGEQILVPLSCIFKFHSSSPLECEWGGEWRHFLHIF